MGKKDYSLKPKSGRKNRFAMVDCQLLESPAFLALVKGRQAAAIAILIRFLQKRRFSKGGKDRKGVRRPPIPTHDDQLRFTYAEAMEIFGISSSTFRNAIKVLSYLGFIKAKDQEHQKETIKYALSNEWKTHKTPPLIDWEKVNASFDRRLPRGVGIPKGTHWDKKTRRFVKTKPVDSDG